MTVLTLTPVLGHKRALEFCARHNSSHVDTAYYALNSDQTLEIEALERLADENFPIRTLIVEDPCDLRSTFEHARTQIAQLHDPNSMLIVLNTNDLLTSRIDIDNVKLSDANEFSIVRNFTYLQGLGRYDSPPKSSSLRIHRGEDSFAYGLTHLDTKCRTHIVNDPLSGYPNLIDPHRNIVQNFSVLKMPIMNVEQFILETVDSWLIQKQRYGAPEPLKTANQTWFERARLLLQSNGASLDASQLEDWFEKQMADPENDSFEIELNLASCEPVKNFGNLLDVVNRTMSLMDTAHQFEMSKQRELRRERLTRIHDSLSILLADLPWSRTWVWQDRAAVLERKWNGVSIAFDVFLTSDEITVQLVNRQKKPLPEIEKLLGDLGVPDVGVAGKPGRYVVGAVQIKASHFSINETRTVEQLIRTIAERMTDHGTY